MGDAVALLDDLFDGGDAGENGGGCGEYFNDDDEDDDKGEASVPDRVDDTVDGDDDGVVFEVARPVCAQ